MSRIAAGTWCADCWLAGHRCQAQILLEARPLCLPCADSEPCSVQRTAAASVAEPKEDMWGEPLPGPVKTIIPADGEQSTPSWNAVARIAETVRSMPVEEEVEKVCEMASKSDVKEVRKPPAGGWFKRLSPEVQEQFRAEITGNASELASKYGVNAATIYNFKKKWGVPTSAPHGPYKKAAPKKALAPHRQLVRRSILIDDQAKPGIDALLHGNGAATPIRINLELNDVQAVNIFTNLSSGCKQVALKAAFEALLG